MLFCKDVDGAAPVVDQCGGHFGPVDSGEVVYHYHRYDKRIT